MVIHKTELSDIRLKPKKEKGVINLVIKKINGIYDLLELLHGVRKSGNQFMALCPAHNDHCPSLSVKDVGDRILIYCFAGCTFKSIMEALGIESTDLRLKKQSQLEQNEASPDGKNCYSDTVDTEEKDTRHEPNK
jgi:DNA primase